MNRFTLYWILLRTILPQGYQLLGGSVGGVVGQAVKQNPGWGGLCGWSRRWTGHHDWWHRALELPSPPCHVEIHSCNLSALSFCPECPPSSKLRDGRGEYRLVPMSNNPNHCLHMVFPLQSSCWSHWELHWWDSDMGVQKWVKIQKSVKLGSQNKTEQTNWLS